MIPNCDADRKTKEFAHELAALARLVTFARQTAQSLNIEFPTYCLDLALASVLEQIVETGSDVSQVMASKDHVAELELH